MSYEQLSEYQPIRQGDIFYPLPRPKLLLDEMETISEDAGSEAAKWSNIKDREKIFITIEVEKTWGIVATQDCDAAQSSPCISLFQVVPFIKVYGSTPSSPSKWVKVLTERICRNASWFYLPKDDSIGISIEMAVNFHRVFQIERTDLERNKFLRRGRLASFAYEHYREAIAQYYRRYPYNEWYPFNKDQLEAYARERDYQVSNITPKYPMNDK